MPQHHVCTSQARLPQWVPQAATHYLVHTETGRSIRALAREAGCHASTVLRQVRRFENRRDDPLVDSALRTLGALLYEAQPGRRPTARNKDPIVMTAHARNLARPDEATLEREARRILRRLCETGAVLAVASKMEKAVVVRDGADGSSTRTAVVDRDVAEAMALKDWIACTATGRISRYAITSTGRAALKRLLAETRDGGQADGFGEQHRAWGEKQVAAGADGPARRMRYNLAESPIAGLARRRGKDGKPFLSDDLVRAGERLREDFELAQMGPRVAQNWDRFLTAGARGGFSPDSGIGTGPAAARARVSAALSDLGPGLGDVVLRCCCFLEGMETAERRMGWSARSGKIVLRIALQRLHRHYEETYGNAARMIG